jgi:hypothetical protein
MRFTKISTIWKYLTTIAIVAPEAVAKALAVAAPVNEFIVVPTTSPTTLACWFAYSIAALSAEASDSITGDLELSLLMYWTSDSGPYGSLIEI